VIPGLRAGEEDSDRPTGPATRLVKAMTPDLRPDPRAALRHMRIRGKLQHDLQDAARGSGLSLKDLQPAPPCDAAAQLGVLNSATDEGVLLEIEDSLANDGANVSLRAE
jgi:hypothetical protein